MTFSYADYKKARGQNSIEKLQKDLEAVGPKAKEFKKDERLWSPALDEKTKTGQAVIRFLPGKGGPAFRSWFEHSFKNKGKMYIESSRTNIDRKEPDPVQEFNDSLYATKREEDSKFVKENTGRRIKYFCNVYIVRDVQAPEREGKVMVWKFGNSIMNKIQAIAKKDEITGQAAIDPFDLLEGVSLHVKSKMKGDFVNYDDSEFIKPAGPLFHGQDADEKTGRVWDAQHDLEEFVDVTKHLKSYEDLKKRFEYVMSDEAPKPRADKPTAGTATVAAGNVSATAPAATAAPTVNTTATAADVTYPDSTFSPDELADIERVAMEE